MCVAVSMPSWRPAAMAPFQPMCPQLVDSRGLFPEPNVTVSSGQGAVAAANADSDSALFVARVCCPVVTGEISVQCAPGMANFAFIRPNHGEDGARDGATDSPGIRCAIARRVDPS